MSAIIVILIIWAVISYIYMKVKNVSYFTALKRVPLVVLKVIFEMGSSSSAMQDIKNKAKRAGRDDVVQKIEEQEDRRKDLKSQIDSKLDE